MLILGLDTSCDDTSAAVVEDGKTILSNIVSSQTKIHSKYGGVVPELASRKHIEMIMPVVDEALKSADVSLSDLSAVSVCHGPGLIGSLLVGCSFAKAVCYSKNIPLVAVNHLEGHILSVFLEPPLPAFPFLSLMVSGGHTSLYIAEGYGNYIELGRTRDDAAGEAYDKVSKLLGLEYPGGPVIDRLALQGNPEAIDFPRAYLPESFDFSFSGLKTAVLNFLKSEVTPPIHPPLNKGACLSGRQGQEGGKRRDRRSINSELRTLNLPTGQAGSELIKDIAASFQASVVDVLVRKTEWALKKKKITRIALSGGVSANSSLRSKMEEMSSKRGVELFIPSLELCTDNAAMIAAAGYHRFINNDYAGLDLNPKSYLPL